MLPKLILGLQLIEYVEVPLVIKLYHIFIRNMTLWVKPISAQLTHDTQIFSNMDPYVIIRVGKQKRQTTIHKEGGKKPNWNDVFTFQMDNKPENIEIKVMDKDLIIDDHIGSAVLQLSKYMDFPGQHKQEVSLRYKNESAGKIMVAVNYVPLFTQKQKGMEIQKNDNDHIRGVKDINANNRNNERNHNQLPSTASYFLPNKEQNPKFYPQVAQEPQIKYPFIGVNQLQKPSQVTKQQQGFLAQKLFEKGFESNQNKDLYVKQEAKYYEREKQKQQPICSHKNPDNSQWRDINGWGKNVGWGPNNNGWGNQNQQDWDDNSW